MLRNHIVMQNQEKYNIMKECETTEKERSGRMKICEKLAADPYFSGHTLE